MPKRMTDAERQRRYRDRQRGGPPRGRWAGHTSMAKQADMFGVGRTAMFMTQWIYRNAPEYREPLMTGQVDLTPTYKKLKREYDDVLEAAQEECQEHGLDPAGIVIFRASGQFQYEINGGG